VQSTLGRNPVLFCPPRNRAIPSWRLIGLFFVILGARPVDQQPCLGQILAFIFGLVWWLVVLFQWFRAGSARESERGLYGYKVDLSFRWSMSWFIFSEVMFFGAFFTALWWARAHSVPRIGQPRKRFALARLQGGMAVAWRPVRRLRLQGSWSPSRPWVPSGCPPSTPHCC
jgi:hypothetical protein